MKNVLGRKPVRKTEPLPPHLRLTKKRLKRIAEQQLRLREAAIARGRLSPEARVMQLGMAHEMSARTDVEMLEGELSQLPAGFTDAGKVAHLVIARKRLAEALAQQGRYNEAAEVEPDKEQARVYLELWMAVWREDDETCPCTPFIDGDVSLTHDHVAQDVISAKHDNKLMPAIRCNCCGFINVRPLTHELIVQQRARHAAAGIVEGRSGKELKASARELLADFHDRKVLRI